MPISARVEWVALTPEEGHFAFGYYDRCPWDAENRLHLALRIPQQERLPLPGERADVGVVDRRTRSFRKLTDTEAWCHQQGAMTMWLTHRRGCFVYNDFERVAGGWRLLAVVWHLEEGRQGSYDRPIYALSRDGLYGASLDFSRIPRRGYSYARAPLPIGDDFVGEAPPDLDGDGLYLIDMATAAETLIASYRRMLDLHPLPHDLEHGFIWLNHAVFNCDGSRLMVLFRYQRQGQKRWKTYMYTVNRDGSDLMCSLPHIYWREGGISHQMWGRTPREVVVDANWCGRGHEYVVFDETVQPIRGARLSPGMGPAGHLMFSPNGEWLVADTYPDSEGIQRLALVRAATGELRELGCFAHRTPGAVGDMRCDLHPRWSADGKLLTVDSIHDGARRIYMLDVESAASELFG